MITSLNEVNVGVSAKQEHRGKQELDCKRGCPTHCSGFESAVEAVTRAVDRRNGGETDGIGAHAGRHIGGPLEAGQSDGTSGCGLFGKGEEILLTAHPDTIAGSRPHYVTAPAHA